MSTTFGSFDEFWAAMARLDDQQLKHDAQIAQLREAQELTNQQMQATDARLDRIASMVATVAQTVARQAEEIDSHERRLERLKGHSD